MKRTVLVAAIALIALAAAVRAGQTPAGSDRLTAARFEAMKVRNIGPALVTGRVTSMTLSNPSDPTTIVNNQFNADGSLNQARVRPQNAGFGAVNAWQAARTVQAYIRFKF